MKDLVNRNSNGTFKHGNSGNPSGRPKGITEMRSLCRTYTEKAIARLVELMDSEDDRVARAACVNILDRGWGTPGTMQEDIVENTAVTAEDMKTIIGDLVERRSNTLPFPVSLTKDTSQQKEN